MTDASKQAGPGGRTKPDAVEAPAGGSAWAGLPLIEHTPKRWAGFLRTRTPILESIIPIGPQGQRRWSALGDESLIAHANWRLQSDGISSPKELKKADGGLYYALSSRGLLDETRIIRTRRTWESLSDDELVRHATEYVRERGITRQRELILGEKADLGLYGVLKSRNLLDRIEFDLKRWKWEQMTDEEIIAIAKKIIAGKGISLRSDLNDSARGDPRVYNILRKRGLLGMVGLDLRSRDWAAMADEKVVEQARRFIQEKGITGRFGLERTDGGMCRVLRQRKLMDKVFSQIESSKHTDSVNSVLDALDSFGDSE